MIVILQNGELYKDRHGMMYEVNNRVKWAEVNSFHEASKLVREYIEHYDLGSSCFTGGDILTGSLLSGKHEKIGRVSYNGRVWDLDGNEILVK